MALHSGPGTLPRVQSSCSMPYTDDILGTWLLTLKDAFQSASRGGAGGH